MTVIVMSKVKPGLRGELSRWLIEPQTGVFVGNPTARVRDRLWERIILPKAGEGSAMMMYSARTEQGFAVRVHGERSRVPVDFDGLTLIAQRVKRSKVPFIESKEPM